MEHLATAYAGEDVIVVSHGGAIRAAVAHSLEIGADNALHFSVANLSLTRLERVRTGWRVVCVNEMSDF
jgi:broad specificity phosphatase PhoE